MSDEREVIDAVQRAREEDLRFFSSLAKPERERWVASDFLTKLGVTFNEEELVSPAQNDDIEVDVRFRDARFQIKEITEPGLRRTAELKASLMRAKRATHHGDLIEPAVAHDIVLSNVTALGRNSSYCRIRKEISVELRRVLLSLGMAALSVAFAPTLGAGLAKADERQAVVAPAVSQASSTAPLPLDLGEVPVCLDSVQTWNPGGLRGLPTPVVLSCTGEECGCFDPPCYEQCPSGDLLCKLACRDEQRECAIACCSL